MTNAILLVGFLAALYMLWAVVRHIQLLIARLDIANSQLARVAEKIDGLPGPMDDTP